ncbi:hypothetical protein Pcinc_042417 [Petrolisthes cinctipes]|uniref:Uncharacterized protein n=1 Tax=Petrolisthes cinctipes TaxID=88211 RepID=A0AAE1EG13_PETCI|nr:hypothetical protein Pcinc_042417 [Petrolisthes cinctipes]
MHYHQPPFLPHHPPSFISLILSPTPIPHHYHQPPSLPHQYHRPSSLPPISIPLLHNLSLTTIISLHFSLTNITVLHLSLPPISIPLLQAVSDQHHRPSQSGIHASLN